MEPDQVHIVTGAVPRNLEQVVHTIEPRLACQFIGDIRDTNRFDRIDYDLSFVHAVTAARLDVGPRPDPDAARNPAAPDSFSNSFRKNHCTLLS